MVYGIVRTLQRNGTGPCIAQSGIRYTGIDDNLKSELLECACHIAAYERGNLRDRDLTVLCCRCGTCGRRLGFAVRLSAVPVARCGRLAAVPVGATVFITVVFTVVTRVSILEPFLYAFVTFVAVSVSVVVTFFLDDFTFFFFFVTVFPAFL